MKKFFLLFFALVFSLSCFAFTQDVSIYLAENGSARIVHEINLNNEKSISIGFLGDNPERIALVSGGNNISFELKDKAVFVSSLQGIKSLNLEYYSFSLTSKQGNLWSCGLSNDSNIDSLSIFLPSTASVSKFSEDASVYFESPFMVVRWDKESIAKEKAEISYFLKMPSEKKEEQIPLIALILIALVLLGGIGYFYYSKLKKKSFAAGKPSEIPAIDLGQKTSEIMQSGNELQPNLKNSLFSESQKDLLKSLNENEKKIILVVSESEGSSQKSITLKSGLSKATVSRIT